MRFIVGQKLNGEIDHFAVDAEDALGAALEVEAERAAAIIMYGRPPNRGGDARHPSPALTAATH